MAEATLERKLRLFQDVSSNDSKSWQDERTLVTVRGIDFLTRRHWLKKRSGVLIQKSDPFPEVALARSFSVQMPAAEVKLIASLWPTGFRSRGQV